MIITIVAVGFNGGHTTNNFFLKSERQEEIDVFAFDQAIATQIPNLGIAIK